MQSMTVVDSDRFTKLSIRPATDFEPSDGSHRHQPFNLNIAEK